MASPEDWTVDHDSLAASEGWGLFIVENRLILQRDDEAKAFPNDAEAFVFVRKAASEGSSIHQLALELNGQPLAERVSPDNRRRKVRTRA